MRTTATTSAHTSTRCLGDDEDLDVVPEAPARTRRRLRQMRSKSNSTSRTRPSFAPSTNAQKRRSAPSARTRRRTRDRRALSSIAIARTRGVVRRPPAARRAASGPPSGTRTRARRASRAPARLRRHARAARPLPCTVEGRVEAPELSPRQERDRDRGNGADDRRQCMRSECGTTRDAEPPAVPLRAAVCATWSAHLDDRDVAGIRREVLLRELRRARPCPAAVGRPRSPGRGRRSRAGGSRRTGRARPAARTERAPRTVPFERGGLTEVDRGVDEHRVDLAGVEGGVRVGELLVHAGLGRRAAIRSSRSSAVVPVCTPHLIVLASFEGRRSRRRSGLDEHALVRLEVRHREVDDLGRARR